LTQIDSKVIWEKSAGIPENDRFIFEKDEEWILTDSMDSTNILLKIKKTEDCPGFEADNWLYQEKDGRYEEIRKVQLNVAVAPDMPTDCDEIIVGGEAADVNLPRSEYVFQTSGVYKIVSNGDGGEEVRAAAQRPRVVQQVRCGVNLRGTLEHATVVA